MGTYNDVSSLSSTCNSCPQGYFSNTNALYCSGCGSNTNKYPTNPLPPSYHLYSSQGLQSTCRCFPGYIGNNCDIIGCDNNLPQGSLLSLLFNAVKEFTTLSANLASDPLTENYIYNGRVFLTYYLANELDFNGDNRIETYEAMAALKYRSVDAKGMSHLPVWNCRDDSVGCVSNTVDKSRVFKEALDCYLYSPKHTFDCSGIPIISNLHSSVPNSDQTSVCELSDQSWRPTSYQHALTNWSYTATAQSQIGQNGKVCIYTNGINLKQKPFNSDGIAKGIVSNFTDPNNNVNVTSYRRVYCIAILYNSGRYEYECSAGLFYVSSSFLVFLLIF